MVIEIKDFFVSLCDKISKVLQINLELKGGCINTIRWRLYRFLQRRKLALRRPTRVSQHTLPEAEALRESFVQSKMIHILMNDIPGSLFIHIGNTAFYFDSPTLLLPMYPERKLFQSNM